MIGLALLIHSVLIWAGVRAQFIGEEKLDPLQKTAVIDGERRDLDKIGPQIFTNRTTTFLNCASGYMNITVNFDEPFLGIIYPNGSRTPACMIHGYGDKVYSLTLPLKGCGTNRVDRRVFVNNIIVRFNKRLELEMDEVKTIICRYPSPEVIPPLPLPPAPPIPFVDKPHHLGEIEILMIICAIVFLALLLFGMACSYTCLKKRNIRIVRHRAISAPPSEISKISGSSALLNVSIPRAYVTSTSDSDTAIVSQSETLPSDYPSESPSSGSEFEEIPEDGLSSAHSDALVQSEAETILPEMILSPPKPTFMVRVKKALTPPRTPEPDYPIQNALSQSLTTILENDESYHGSRPGSEYALMMTESEADLSLPPPIIPPPDFSEVSVVQRPKVIDVQHIENVQLIQQQITDIEETVERGKRRYLAPIAPSEPDSDYPSEVRSIPDFEELPIVHRRPDISTHMVDDRYFSTQKETYTTEDIEKHRRFIKQYHHKPKPLPPPKWDVAIRNYPGPKYADELESSGPEWEAFSEPGSDVFRAQMLEGIDDRLSQIDVETLEHPPPPNWRVLLRVLEPPTTEEAVTYYLSTEDREKWRQIITTESTLRTMLSTATVREDYERIRRDQRYEKLFEPHKWDVIIRILSPPHVPSRPGDETSSEAPSMSDTEIIPSIMKDGKRSRKHDIPGGKKISLPPLHEYDSDGRPIIKKTSGPLTSRSRRSSKSSLVSGDVRSLAETEVNFTRIHVENWDEASGPSSPGRDRSPSGRFHSEIRFAETTHHDEDYPDTDFDDRLSGRTARSLARSASEFMEDWRHPQDRIDRYSESSIDSKPNRQRERSTSEYMEEAPHLSDFPTSPEGSPQMAVRRYGHYSSEHAPMQHQSQSYHHGQFHHSEATGQRFESRERVVHREVTSSRAEAGYRNESHTQDGNDPVSKF